MSTNRFFIALSFLFFVGFSFSQKNSEVKQWRQLQNTDGLKIDFRKGNCDQPKVASYTEDVYLKFTNTTEQVLLVTWTYDVTYGERCINCDGTNEEMITTLKLAPNSSLEGECGDKNDLRMRIFSKFTKMENIETLTDFHVKVLSVELPTD